NELARELEVKPSVILKILPEIGVAGKKTHSSSIEVDEAAKVRQHLGAQEADSTAAAPAQPDKMATPGTTVEAQETDGEKRVPSAVVIGTQSEQTAQTEGEGALESTEAPPLGGAGIQEFPVERPKPQPLRPPLASGKGPGSPPVGQRPVPPPAPRQQRTVPIPAKPVPPALKPGQILSGPRQPLPPGLSEVPQPSRSQQGGLARAKAPTPAIPRAPVQSRPRPHAPSAPPPAQKPKGPLVGQPAARPVVPPRPDLVARLAQQAKVPGPPQQPRPGQPKRGPVPGQPIYRGPIRPGQPILRGPGAPAGRRRPHPTSGRLEPPAPPPAATQRRHQTKPGGRGQVRERERDREGKLRAPTQRRSEPVFAVNRDITIAEGITVKELSEKLGLKASLVIRKLVDRKIFATINQALDAKLASDLAGAFGAKSNKVSFEEESVQDIEQAEVEKDLATRPPVVTVMGHVDHGKTSLLDAIRTTRVAEREAGGITQHIGAYHVEKDGHKIIFIDTPGHEAFTRMRARGAKVTDIVVLVVAADDGVMPQTLEAIDHAKAAEVPIIVAVNKIDRPDANPDRVKQQLADRDLLAEDWGGKTVTVPVSAKTQEGLDLLLEMVLLVSDMQDLKANPGRPAVGTVLEAQLDRGRGPVATVLVRNGSLNVGDHFICGSVFGRVRAMFDDRGEPVKTAGPSMPVEVLGLDTLPEVGDTYQVVTDTVKAKQIVLYRETKAREKELAKSARVTLDKLHEQLREGDTKELNVILKADVGGTAEVLTDTLQKLSTDKVKVRAIHSGVGAITESDVLLATASDGVIVGFNVRPERSATNLADQEKVDIRLHTIIYELTDEIKKAMTGMLEPVFKEVYRGRAEVRETFRITKVGTIAGCAVQDGSIMRDSQIRLLRDNVVVHTGKLGSLKRFKDDVSEVKTGFECGIGIDNFNDVKPGDIIEGFVKERVKAEALA
ncbi:MAG: translation initiation factor IF-2, partial [bacterium]|nr:translation initiation factor IF-2 [bacterium]